MERSKNLSGERMNNIEAAAKMAGEWWAEKLIGDFKEKSAEFAKAVETRVLAELRHECHWPYFNDRVKGPCPFYKHRQISFTECDYEPKGLLFEAINEVFPNAENTNLFLRGILPQKHSLTVTPDMLKPKEGYGVFCEHIMVNPVEQNDAQDQSNAM